MLNGDVLDLEFKKFMFEEGIQNSLNALCRYILGCSKTFRCQGILDYYKTNMVIYMPTL